MSNVVQFIKHQPHNAGPAKCAACQHEWIAIAPVGAIDELECPSCHTMKGLMIYGCVPESIWTCGCGCFVFTVSGITHDILCWNCGTAQRFPS